MKRNDLTADTVNWVVPHEANLRIIEAVTKRVGIPMEKVMVNIQHYGNTSAATIPLALWDYEKELKKGDNIVFTAFGAGFVHSINGVTMARLQLHWPSKSINIFLNNKRVLSILKRRKNVLFCFLLL